ncbi:hypothetical protein NV379_22895 [Paenibacillus sp. N1-5-1-14]|uniref:hypothetical protein n=1 Tax=Paenibacillus radicibacter TaxID=2972488 RepID=UPI002158E7D8|nr:hypothetical protein [Paenibacillus radicibacter]MCR8645489.1 hypothetical protein [Paenibacillus radicibacter]
MKNNRFQTKTSYSLDALNFLNVLTEDEFYTQRHESNYRHFIQSFSQKNKCLMSEIVRINGGNMLSPFLTLVVSSIPNFDSQEISELFDSATIHSYFSQTSYYKESIWEQKEPLFKLVPEIILELEKIGFKEFWYEHKQPLLLDKIEKITSLVDQHSIFDEINDMLGPTSNIDEIILYLCSYAAPHGIKIVGPRFISDVSYPTEITLSIAIHEMFHPPYRIEQLNERFNDLKVDPKLIDAFDKQKERFGYKTIEGFIEENVVEAMALYICEKIGLEKDPFAYLEKHDEGSHVLSVTLLKYLQSNPKNRDVSFQDYFNEFLQRVEL